MGPVARFADSLHNVVHLFASPSHPILHTAVLCFVSTLALFAGSYLSRRGSWHRMFWAAAPPLIVVSFGTGPGLWNPRQWALVVAVWIWAARHALNLWWRRDTLHMPDWLLQRPGAAGGEPHWLASLLCFHLYPAALLSLLCVPMYYAMSPSACTGLECACGAAEARPAPPGPSPSRVPPPLAVPQPATSHRWTCWASPPSLGACGWRVRRTWSSAAFF